MTESAWQELLWALPSDMGWRWYALWGAVGVVAAAIIFLVAILGQPFNAMMVCRTIFCVGLCLIPLAALNSGYQPWIPVFYAGGALAGALSLTIDRCDRETETTTVGGALVEKARRAAAVLLSRAQRGR